MRSNLRVLALCLVGGILAAVGFTATTAIASHQFSDVPTGSAFHDDIGWLTHHGVASGFPGGTFRPTDPVNRQQASRWFRNYNAQIALVSQSFPSLANGAGWEVGATCTGSRRAVAGGVDTADPNLFIAESYPQGESWIVRIETEDEASIAPNEVVAWALCAPDNLTAPS